MLAKVAAVASLASSYVFIWTLLRFTQDSREPPTLENAIPFLSPVIGMVTRGSKFHSYLRLDIVQIRRQLTHSLTFADRDKYKLPPYTLRLPGSRLYIINDTSLIPVVQRQVRTLSISPMMVRVFSHFMGVSKQGLDIMGRDPIEHHGFVHQMTLETGKGLSPGPNLDEPNAQAVHFLNSSLDVLCSKQAPTTVHLFEWVSHEIMMATTNAIYGVRNPFKDPIVRAAYYKYEAGLITLITGFLPSIVARESLQARETLTKAFIKYYTEGGLNEGSSVYARNRFEYPSKIGVLLQDVARMEVRGSIRLISNIMLATFWMIYYAFADLIVLENCRQEILMKLTALKGNTVLIPSTIQHSSSLTWGSDVAQFYHKRFLKESGIKKHDNVAFRAFGGGATLCPGRHFASTEILAFASAILLQFDIKPSNTQDIDVNLVPRDNKTWHVFFSQPGKPMEVSDNSATTKEDPRDGY
ncbi:cytochrome P450 oxidoreductase [Hypoxylon sp. FL1150]|nr:cytochrome P450 oxidoreductase [Hypoxylon sp. FL1150]